MGTSTFPQNTLHPSSVSQAYGHKKKGHVYIILEEIKPARWHLCIISPLLPQGGCKSLPASGSFRPKPQAQTKKRWKLSLAGESLCSPHYCDRKASLVPAPPSQHVFLQDQPPSHHPLWWQLGPVVNMATGIDRKVSLDLLTIPQAEQAAWVF